MTPLPKRKLSTKRQGKRRESIRLTAPKLDKCKNCGEAVESHKVCRNCGYYAGRAVKTPKKKAEKK